MNISIELIIATIVGLAGTVSILFKMYANNASKTETYLKSEIEYSRTQAKELGALVANASGVIAEALRVIQAIEGRKD